MKLSRILMPSGGWKYLQGKILLIAETHALLVSNVRAHRYHNGIPQGNIEQDIEDQYVKANPQLYKVEVRA